MRWESVIVAVFGTLSCLSLGVFLGWGLVRKSRRRDAHGVLDPGGPTRLILAVGALVGLIAGLRTARRAARLDLLPAIATE